MCEKEVIQQPGDVSQSLILHFSCSMEGIELLSGLE
jgi:hypothetical protein